MTLDIVDGLYNIIRLKPFRRTTGVRFDVLVRHDVPKVDAVDRVIHIQGAVSPGSIAGVKRPWYMHTHQDDNLLVLSGRREVELYNQSHGKIESFTVTPDRIERNGRILIDEPAILVWPRYVFHRVKSGDHGSISVNLATHYDGFNLKDNFNIYDLDPETGDYRVIRQGFLDQMPV